VDVIVSYWQGLLAVLDFTVLGYMVLGVVVGLFVGLVPGLGGPVAIAVALPFTLDMSSVEAFAFLLAMLSVTSVAGDLTAIVFGIPGEPTSAALVLDGHALAKQGKAGIALGASLVSSVIGAVIGAAVLALAIPVLRPLILVLGSPEMFMVTVVGLLMMSSLTSGSAIKGLLAGTAGLLLSTIGLDNSSGVPRFTFGMLGLWEGVGLIAVTLGLFGIPEIVDLIKRKTTGPVAERGLSGVLTGIKVGLGRWPMIVRGSVVGTVVGVLPGLGGSVAQWAAYGQARQNSKEKHLFGKGAIDGIVAPGAANNAKEGGSLIPTIAFGIPGSVTMAVLLGAFIMHGVVPGPEMVTTNLSLTTSFIWTIIFANILAVVLCLFISPTLLRLASMRSSVLVAPILWLLVIGAFAERNQLIDVALMAGFGLLGVAMVQADWPRAPLLFGLVLGSISEKYLALSISRYGMSWIERPVVVGLAVLLVAGLVIGAIRRRSARSTVMDVEVLERR
jgi:TctA family transporter